MSAPSYTYTIYDADPSDSGAVAWPTHTGVAVAASDDADARAQVRAILLDATRGLHSSDGYEAGQILYATVWRDGRNVGTVRATIAEVAR